MAISSSRTSLQGFDNTNISVGKSFCSKNDFKKQIRHLKLGSVKDEYSAWRIIIYLLIAEQALKGLDR